MELFNNFGELFHKFVELFEIFGELSQTFGELFNIIGELFYNFGEPFNNFGEPFHNFGEFFNIIEELLTNCVLAILKDLVNFGEFWVILLHLDQLGSNNFGRFSQFWSILGDFASFSSLRFQ